MMTKCQRQRPREILLQNSKVFSELKIYMFGRFHWDKYKCPIRSWDKLAVSLKELLKMNYHGTIVSDSDLLSHT